MKTRQSGQAMVLAIVMMSAILVAFVSYFNTAQVAAAKLKQNHSLDAATYSGALVQARALNTLAYINRSQIGHQVAMAHLVTLGSWAHFAGTEARQLARGNPPAYLIAMMFGSNHGKAYLAAAKASGFDAMAYSHNELASAFSQHDEIINQRFLQAQAEIVNSLPVVRRNMILEVLEKNYAPADFSQDFELQITQDDWPNYVKLYSGQDLIPFIRQVTDLYRFLDRRDYTKKNNWVVDTRCPSKRHELRRRGYSKMDEMGRWQSMDTQSFHALRSNRWIGCYFREYSMGWGWIPTSASAVTDVEYVDNPPENFSSQDFWRWVRDATDWNIAESSSNSLANSMAVANKRTWFGGGVKPFFDLSNKNKDSVGFATTLIMPGPGGLKVTTKSAAKAFFVRPDFKGLNNSPNKNEYSSLFRAYWQARLQ